ncbi:MAG: hypothetical protein D8M59_15435 [Planctomycetes bacterium]|nr:hypothetical protein [Planctomycetota bacterium]
MLPSVAAHAQEATESDTNPRNHRYDRLVIDYLEISPKVEVREVGDRPHAPEAEEATLTVYLRNLSDKRVYAAIEWGRTIGMEEVGYLSPGETMSVPHTLPTAEIPYGSKIEAAYYDSAVHQLVPTDSVLIHPADAMRVALVVEKKTWEAGNKRFGSFTRRMRDSFESLHDMFENGTAPAVLGLERVPVTDRFRIDHVEVYEQQETAEPDDPDETGQLPDLPPLFEDHPQYDLVINCNEGGRLGGFWMPHYTIGHTFYFVEEGEPVPGSTEPTQHIFDLWSTWGEHALWHEMIHFRGVGDIYIYEIPAGALSAWTDEAVPVPEPWATEVLNYPYRDDIIVGPLAAAVMNSKAGIARVGSCEDTTIEYGHMWKWVPAELKVAVTDAGGASALAGATVKWWASRSAGLEDARVQGVAADRADSPDGQGSGEAASITGDYLNGGKDNWDDRSLWLLVEVTHPKSGERRFGIVYGLWLNTAYAAGNTESVTWTISWDELKVAK